MTSLKEGDKAPNFSVLNQDDKLLTLDTYKGKKLILYFYPKDSTPGCTAESCNLRDNYSELLDLGYDVLGKSLKDSMREAFLSFFEKIDHTRVEPYPVLARWRDDIHLTIASIADFQPHVTSGSVEYTILARTDTTIFVRTTGYDGLGWFILLKQEN